MSATDAGRDGVAGTAGTPAHRWRFAPTGGVNQVVFRNGEDIARIGELDQKLWLALAMPVAGVEYDPRTAALIDTDGDGRIRPTELIAAVQWAKGAFKDLGLLMEAGDAVPLDAIRDPELLSGARSLLTHLGKPNAAVLTMEDVADQSRIFASTKFNGDGIVHAEAADDEPTRKAIGEVIAAMGAVTDRSGKPGIDLPRSEAFFAQAGALVAWAGRPAAEPALLPLGAEATAAAAAAVRAVRAKVDDYFARCRLAAFDARALAALNREEKDYLAVAACDLTISSQEIGAFPLARIEAGRALPLDATVNPAWAAAVEALAQRAVRPLLGFGRAALTEAEWAAVQAQLAPHEAWLAAKPATAVEPLGLPRLRELVEGGAQAAIAALIRRDADLAADNVRIASAEKLVRFRRDLFELVTNYVNFADFYGRTWAVFQAGTLYLDARACELCVEVADAAKHAVLAGQASAFLAYCDVTRPGGLKKTIVAVVTDGDSDALMVGRNGIYYDRKGRDWDATVTKIVSNPISLREAFWMPYKKLVRFIEEQVAKRAQSAEAASLGKMSDVAVQVAAAPAAGPAAPPAPPKKIDLGTIALIGTAIGGVSALVAGFLQALFGLGLWLPVGVAGMLLLISGPSVLLTWMKLRTRNLGPILDANGWAINTRARMNVPFGAALTRIARLPPGSERRLEDPYAEKKRPWKLIAVLAVAAVLAYVWWLGKLNTYLPPSLQHGAPAAAVEKAPAPPPAP